MGNAGSAGNELPLADDLHRTAGWNIPRLHRTRFAADGSPLQRYGSRLNAAEINTSFYRPHAAA